MIYTTGLSLKKGGFRGYRARNWRVMRVGPGNPKAKLVDIRLGGVVQKPKIG